MGTTKKHKQADRRLGGRLRPHFDRLEARMALSGSSFDPAPIDGSTGQFDDGTSSSSLSIVDATPSSSSVLTSSPSSLSVSFDRPLDGSSLRGHDFKLFQVNGDGSIVDLGSGKSGPIGTLDSSDTTGSRILLTLSKPLADGEYRLVLQGSSQIMGLDGTSMSGDGSDVVVSDFTVSLPKAGLADSIDLGTIGSTETVHADLLDLSTDPGAVRYYKISVATGHHWRLGLEISAFREGSTLSSSLSLFDARGHLISTDSLGLSGDPVDPYLFAGVDPGTYYVGVSAKTNFPDASGTYNATNTAAGTTNSGGPFRLHLVADPADRPTQVLGLRVDRADPLSTNPTGLTLQFSGPIGVAGLQDPRHPGLTLVDQDGKSWPITLLRYDANLARLSLAFDQSLAPGTYTLQVAGARGLVDLAGKVPMRFGLSAGVLGSFTATRANAVPGDLGPILPGIADSDLTAKLAVGPANATVEQFVVIQSGVYSFRGLNSSPGVKYSVQDASGNVLTSGVGTAGAATTDLPLAAGIYRVVLIANETSASEVDLTIWEKVGQASSFLDGGVSQAPALNLRLVAPQADIGRASSDPGTTADPTSTATNPPAPTDSPPDSGGGGSNSQASGRASGAGVTVAVGLSTPSGPSVAGLLYGAGPVGRASSQSSQISFVGPSGTSGLAALASTTDGLPAGLMVVPVAIDGGGQLEPDAPPLDPDIKGEGPVSSRAGITLESGLLARAPGSRRADDLTLAEADWIGQITSNAIGWMEGLTADRGAVVAESSEAGPVVPPAGGESVPEEARLETASFASPVGVGVVLATIAYRYRRNLLGRARGVSKAGPKSNVPPILVGPHRRTRVRVR